LPEVEVTRQSFCERIHGARVTAVRLGKPLRWPLGVAAAGLGRTRGGRGGAPRQVLVAAAATRGPRAGGLLLHLGMSGSLAFTAAPGDAGAHDHFDLVTTRGTLRLTDPRRFGAVVWAASRDDGMARSCSRAWASSRSTPRSTARVLHAALKRRRVAVKLALMAGDIVVGAGQHLCVRGALRRRDRSAHAQRPHQPATRRASRRGGARHAGAGARARAARRCVTSAMHTAWKDASSSGPVYGAPASPCGVCGTPIRRVVQGQRSTLFCPTCQRR
jgi:formamidopyrimidine-DNA glycosylase